jgi:hypothetical protein
MVSLNDVVLSTEHLISRPVDGETVIVSPVQGRTRVLNRVGSRIWALADGTRTIGEIVQTICDEYDVPPAEAEADALAFVERLVEDGVLVVRTKAPG